MKKTTQKNLFQKLHRKLTIFCTLMTGGIFAVLTLLCLVFAENSIRENYYNSFLMELNTTISHLQDQDVISQRWLGTLASNSSMQIYLYDNQMPLFDPNLAADPQTNTILPELIQIAAKDYDMNIFPANAKKLTAHTEFSYQVSKRTYSKQKSLYVSAGYIPKNGGILSFLILFDQTSQIRQCLRMRLIILLVNIVAFVSLGSFSCWLTGRIIVPLEQAQKKQTLFIASASHELRSPLSVLRSGLEVLRKTDEPGQETRVLDMLSDETIHMEHLVSDMLTLASADSDSLPLQMSPCQPDGILLNVYEKFESIAHRKNIRMKLTLPDNLLPDCTWDRERIEQACSILVDNALSYTPQCGAIYLELARLERSVYFIVTDTGCGIPDEEKDAIFDRFYRAEQSRSSKGHFGLGLCIAKEIVTAHGGTIRLEDNPGGGSRFIVVLPVKKT